MPLSTKPKIEIAPLSDVQEAKGYLAQLNLDSVYQVEEILLGLGKSINPKKIEDGVPHPREVFSYVAAYETLYRHGLEDPAVSKDEYMERLKQVKELDRMVDEEENPKKKALFTKARNSFSHAGQRLKYLENGERSVGTKIKELKERRAEDLANNETYRAMWENIGDGAATVGTGLIAFAVTKEPLVAVGTSSLTLAGRAGKYLTAVYYDKKEKKIHGYYDPKISDWHTIIKFQRHKILVQTLAEYVNTLGDTIPGSVIDAELA